MANQLHVCSACGKEWKTENGYLNHKCSESNTTPQDPAHLVNTTTPNYEAISTAALKRGKKND